MSSEELLEMICVT